MLGFPDCAERAGANLLAHLVHLRSMDMPPTRNETAPCQECSVLARMAIHMLAEDDGPHQLQDFCDQSNSANGRKLGALRWGAGSWQQVRKQVGDRAGVVSHGVT